LQVVRQADERGVATPRPLAAGWLSHRGRSRSVLITEFLSSAVGLDAAWSEAARPAPAPLRRQTLALIGATADLLAVAHTARVMHRDLHARNILVRALPEGASDAWLVDLHGASLRRHAPMKHLALNLAQLDQHFHRVASRTDRLRFVCHYLAARRGLEPA